MKRWFLIRDPWLGFALLGLLLGLSGIAWGLWDYLFHTPGVVIEEPERELTQVVAGQEQTVEFPIHNRTWHGARIVGLGVC